ncbi:hypothetical protein AVEN_228945-1 [Araneus ventricosus]|uniref:Uncharacterized protein n=1 Tax=Araneus ventricosus TaxID=182803 RepID=A0A4Y2IG73_ARAVE|nr:hypothetical protein AVEN_228945-1 [Araneus ventricosus]
MLGIKGLPGKEGGNTSWSVSIRQIIRRVLASPGTGLVIMTGACRMPVIARACSGGVRQWTVIANRSPASALEWISYRQMSSCLDPET